MMANVQIRSFRHTDIDALVQIAQASFAGEMRAQGMTPEDFIAQVRMVTRGRMIPFRVVAALAGIKWELLVAEVNGQVVGCGGYVGRQHIELGNLMVAPDYRRQGIGQRLLEERLRRLGDLGYEQVTTLVLANNEASLGNLKKQGFEPFDEYTVLNSTLPLPSKNEPATETIVARPVQSSDKQAFESVESQIITSTALQLQGSSWSNYSPSPSERTLNRLTGAQRWSYAFEQNGQIIGFLLASTSRNQNIGFIARPAIIDAYIDLVPALIHEPAMWLTKLGKTEVRITIPSNRPLIVEDLHKRNWVTVHSWLRLAKLLNRAS